MLFNEIAAPLRRVLFPAFSKMDPESNEFYEAYMSNIAGLFFVLAPVSVGVALVAPLFVPLLLGEKWIQTIQPIQLLSCAMAISIIGRIAQSAIMSTGNTRMLFMRNLFFSPVKLVAIFAGAYFYGLEGAVWALVFQIVLMMILNVEMVNKMIGIGFFKHFYAVRDSILPLSVMVASVSLFCYPTDIRHSNTFDLVTDLTSIIFIGVLSYSFTHYVLWRVLGEKENVFFKFITLINNIRN